MKSPKPNLVTMWNEGQFGDKEFVVSCRGRPFSILTAPQFPTPDVTYVDFNLIHELNIKMSDLQCRKLSYGGQRLRILGKISTSVQCIVDGASAGNLQFKAHVVEDLKKHFDTHSIAGVKLSGKLLGQPSKPLADNSTEPTTDEESKSEPSSSDQEETTENRTNKKKKRNARIRRKSSSSTLSSMDQSLSRDTASDEYKDVYTNVSTIRTYEMTDPPDPDDVAYGPGVPSSAILMMQQKCHHAGMNSQQTIEALQCAGVSTTEMNRVFNMPVTKLAQVMTVPNAVTSDHSEDQHPHGSDKCTVLCESISPYDGELPDECGYSPNFLPEDFIPCSRACPGAWCPCYQRWLLRKEGGRRRK